MKWTEQGTLLFAFAIFMGSMSTIFVVLRFISRGYILHVLGPTDWFMLLTLLFSIGNTVCICLHVANGLGYPFASLTPDEKEVVLKLIYSGILVVNLSQVLAKISVLLLFINIFVMTTIRKAALVITVAVALYGLAITLSNLFFCIPPSSFWRLDNSGGVCVDGPMKWLTEATLNLIFDLAIFVLPLPVVGSMTLPWRQRAWLYFVFLLGFFVCIVSAVRLYFIYIATQGAPWESLQLTTWAAVEAHVPIAIACIPTLRPLAMRLCPRLLTGPCPGRDDSYGLSHPPTISSPPRRLTDTESDDIQASM